MLSPFWQSLRLVKFDTLITILTIENLNLWQSLLPDNKLWHWTAFAILAMFVTYNLWILILISKKPTFCKQWECPICFGIKLACHYKEITQQLDLDSDFAHEHKKDTFFDISGDKIILKQLIKKVTFHNQTHRIPPTLSFFFFSSVTLRVPPLYFGNQECYHRFACVKMTGENVCKKILKKSNALSHNCTVAWVTRPERQKGVKDVIKQSRKAAT